MTTRTRRRARSVPHRALTDGLSRFPTESGGIASEQVNRQIRGSPQVADLACSAFTRLRSAVRVRQRPPAKWGRERRGGEKGQTAHAPDERATGGMEPATVDGTPPRATGGPAQLGRGRTRSRNTFQPSCRKSSNMMCLRPFERSLKEGEPHSLRPYRCGQCAYSIKSGSCHSGSDIGGRRSREQYFPSFSSGNGCETTLGRQSTRSGVRRPRRRRLGRHPRLGRESQLGHRALSVVTAAKIADGRACLVIRSGPNLP